MNDPLPKLFEPVQSRAKAALVLDQFGRLTAAEAIEVIPEFMLAAVERDPIRGGALT